MHEKLMDAILTEELRSFQILYSLLVNDDILALLVAPLIEVPLVRLFLARFCFCYTVMSLHLEFLNIVRNINIFTIV